MGLPLAGSETTTHTPPVQLFAGEAPVTTNRAEGGSDVVLPVHAVIALVANKIVPFNWYASDGSEKAAGILATPLNTKVASGGVAGDWAPYFTGGDFNHAALAWPMRAGTPVQTGDGNGTLSNLVTTPAAVAETWTLTCTAKDTNAGTFSVVGSVSGATANATVGVAYDNGLVKFTLTDGSTDFEVGDKFVFAAAAPSLAEARSAFASTSTIKISTVL